MVEKRWGRSLFAAAAAVFTLGLVAPAAMAAEAPVPASLSDIRVTKDAVNTTLVVRGDEAVEVDPATVKVTMGGKPATVTVQPAAQQSRSTMLVIDTSGSMGATGMGTVRSAVRQFLSDVPKDVKVGVVSFASTAGVDVAPTTDHAKVSREVASLRSKGETALYEAIQVAVSGLGTKGERSIVLLSDGGDTVAEIEGGKAGEASERKAALTALKRAKVRAEVVAFKSPESNGAVLKQFADAGGGSVAQAEDRPGRQQRLHVPRLARWSRRPCSRSSARPASSAPRSSSSPAPRAGSPSRPARPSTWVTWPRSSSRRPRPPRRSRSRSRPGRSVRCRRRSSSRRCSS